MSYYSVFTRELTAGESLYLLWLLFFGALLIIIFAVEIHRAWKAWRGGNQLPAWQERELTKWRRECEQKARRDRVTADERIGE